MSILPRRYTARVCCQCGTPFLVKLSRNVQRGEARWLPVHDRRTCEQCRGK